MRYALVIVCAAVLLIAPIAAQIPPPVSSSHATQADSGSDAQQPKANRPARGEEPPESPDAETQVDQLLHAAVRLPIAAGLASILAFRPRRRGAPLRESAVIHTQI